MSAPKACWRGRAIGCAPCTVWPTTSCGRSRRAAGLDDAFLIVDERESNAILGEAVEAWVRKSPTAPDAWLAQNYLENAYYRTHHWTQILTECARSFIRQAKDELLTPADISAELASRADDLTLARICAEIYEDYDRALRYRGAVDFQDLIRLALTVLRRDAAYLAALRRKWVHILEDEAQDSSRLQEDILHLLAGEGGNWVRVGDPNQAIFETFTTADPRYLREFIAADGVLGRELPNSGRSTRSIQKLANHLIRWSLDHPQTAIRERMPLSKPYIQPTPTGDPQPNPPDNPEAVILYAEAFSATKEAVVVTESCKRWLEANPEGTAAILVARNARGSEIVKFLREKRVPYVENLNSTSSTRAVVGALALIMEYLAEPTSAAKLARVYQVWRRDDRDESAAEIEAVTKRLKGIKAVEDYVAPRLRDWLEETLTSSDSAYVTLQAFRRTNRRLDAGGGIAHRSVDLDVGRRCLQRGGEKSPPRIWPRCIWRESAKPIRKCGYRISPPSCAISPRTAAASPAWAMMTRNSIPMRIAAR